MRAAVGTLLVAATAAVTLAACDSGSHAARHSASTPGSGSAPSSTAPAAPTTPSTGGPTTPAGHAPGAASTSVDTGTVAPYPTSTNGLVPDIPANQAAALNSLPGSAATSCATVGSHTTDLHAGSVAVGNFVTARKSFASQYGKTEGPSVFLYLIPLHSKTMKKAVVTIDPLGSGATKTVTSTDVETANQYRYFALNLLVPQPGSYRLTMVSGADRGCYDVTFSK